MAYDAKRELIPRPKKQDIKPKAFDYPATFIILNYHPLTDRYILWMIAHYPYLFNVLFNEDIAKISMAQTNNDSNFGKALQILADLKRRKLIKESKDKMKLKITLTGYFVRATTYPGFGIIAPTVAISATLFVFLFNRIFPTHTEYQIPLKKDSTITKLYDSEPQLRSPVPVFLDTSKHVLDTSKKEHIFKLKK